MGVASPPSRAKFGRETFMEKRLAQLSLAVSVLMGGVFLLDMVAGIPYGRVIALDFFGLIAALLIALMSLSVLREQP